jgi:hypothetical protein
VLTLSDTQAKALQADMCVLELCNPSKGYGWNVSSIGPDFDTRKNGMLVTRCENLSMLKKHVKFFYTGHGSETTIMDPNLFVNKLIHKDIFVVLAAWVHDNKCQPIWEGFDTSMLDSIADAVRNNIHDGMKHFGLYGKSFGFGAQASYLKVDSNNWSSVGEYVERNRKCEPILKKGVACVVENWIAKGIEEASTKISEYMGGNPVRDGCIMLKTIQKEWDKLTVQTADHRRFIGKTYFTSVYLNVNGGTSKAHQELDSTYTMISVPAQQIEWDVSVSLLQFHFKLSKGENTSIPLAPGSHLFFNAFLLSHFQECKPSPKENLMYNVSAYGNRQLVNNLQTSLTRGFNQQSS